MSLTLTPTPNPIRGPNQWMYFTLRGRSSPGTIARNGIRGFNRETGWDEKKGKGTQGATLTLVSAPPAKGSITLQLFQAGKGSLSAIAPPPVPRGRTIGSFDEPGLRKVSLESRDDFADWDSFVKEVLSIDSRVQQAEGLQIFYPGFASIGLTSVVVKDWSPIQHVGKGLYHVEINLIEWRLPPPVSIVSTAAATSDDVPDTNVPPPPDPEAEARQAQIALLLQAAGITKPGSFEAFNPPHATLEALK